MLAECEGCIRGTRTSNAQSVLGPSGYVVAGNFPYRPPAPYNYALHREGSRRGFVSPVLYFNIGASKKSAAAHNSVDRTIEAPSKSSKALGLASILCFLAS